MKKFVFPVILFFCLILPLMILGFFGYPVKLEAREAREQLADTTNRCFILGESRSLFACFRLDNAKISRLNLLIYFQDFKYQLAIIGLSMILLTYCAIWLIYTEDTGDGSNE